MPDGQGNYVELADVKVDLSGTGFILDQSVNLPQYILIFVIDMNTLINSINVIFIVSTFHVFVNRNPHGNGLLCYCIW